MYHDLEWGCERGGEEDAPTQGTHTFLNCLERKSERYEFLNITRGPVLIEK
jgi:hypothetical protein